ncbi:hypothetical protein EDD11_004691, partial [Mortierella claussenii]
MGVRQLFGTLNKNGLPAVPCDVEMLRGRPLHVDLFGAYWSRIVTLIVDKYGDGRAEQVGRQLAVQIAAAAWSSNATIHIDGASSVEKRDEHRERTAVKDKHIKKLVELLKHMRQRSGDGRWTSPSRMKTIKSSLRQIFVLDKDDKDKLAVGLASPMKDGTSFKVCQCLTESDVSDTDILIPCHIPTLLRPIPRSSGLAMYNKYQAARVLELPTTDHLVLLGIVGHNDYSKNVPTLGPIRNIAIIKTLPSAPIDTLLQLYIIEAERTTGSTIDRLRFETSRRVFVEHDDNVDSEASPKSNQAFKKCNKELQDLKQLRFDMAYLKKLDNVLGDHHALHYKGRNTKSNKYRPLFESISTMLKGKEVDLRDTKPVPRPVQKPRSTSASTTPRAPGPEKPKRKRKGALPRKSASKGQARKPSEATKRDRRLRKDHPMRALTVGCIQANLRRTLGAEQVVAAISEHIQKSVHIINTIQRAAYEAIALDLDRIIRDNSGDSAPSSEDLQDLADILDNNNSTTTYQHASFDEDEERPETESPIVYFFFRKNRDPKVFADFAMSKLSPSFISLSECDLLHILQRHPVGWKLAQKILSCQTIRDAEQAVWRSKGRLIERLLYKTGGKRRDGYNWRTSLQQQSDQKTRFKLRGLLATSGLQLHLIAFDTSKPRYQRPWKGKEKDKDDEDEDEGDGDEGAEDISDLLDVDLEESFKFDSAFLDRGVDEEEDNEEPSPSRKRFRTASMATNPPKPHERVAFDPKTINWKRGSDMLKSVEVEFGTPEQCCPFTHARVVGIDPGEVNTATATLLDPARPHHRQTVTIRRKYLYRPFLLFRRQCMDRKNKAKHAAANHWWRYAIFGVHASASGGTKDILLRRL